MALDKTKILESFIGTVAGAAVALVSFWVQSEYKERQSIQSWFEDEYVGQAIDPVSTFISILKLHLQRPDIDFSIQKELPLKPLTRIETLAGSSAYSDALTVAVRYSGRFRQLNDMQQGRVLDEIDKIKLGVAELRKWALEQEIDNKSAIYEARLEPTIISLVGDMNSIVDHLGGR